MAFVRSTYSAIPQHCKDDIVTASLENSIFFVAMDAKRVRITFSVTLSQGQRDILAGGDCFMSFMTHDDKDAVMFTRFP